MRKTMLEIQEEQIDAEISALVESLLNPKGAWGYYTWAADSRLKLAIIVFRIMTAYRSLLYVLPEKYVLPNRDFFRKCAEGIIQYPLNSSHPSQSVQNLITQKPDLIQPSSHLANLLGVFFETILTIIIVGILYLSFTLRFVFYDLKANYSRFFSCLCGYLEPEKLELEKENAILSVFCLLLGTLTLLLGSVYTMALLALKFLILDIITPLNLLYPFLTPLGIVLWTCLHMLLAITYLFFLLLPAEIFILICGAIAVSVYTMIYACQDSIEACVTLGQKAYSTTLDLGVSTVSTLFSSIAKKDNAEPDSCTDPAPGFPAPSLQP